MSLARFVAATNDNSVVREYLARGVYRPRPSVATIYSAMDVGDPGNFRRILHLFGTAGGTVPFTASSWTDRETRTCIRDLWRSRGIAIDPHTAVGLLGLRVTSSDVNYSCHNVMPALHFCPPKAP